ncbi:MAG TPA: hypothetical protein VES69_03065 [Pyrinomonadaceae bacterium]|nr:hypothetical protein [Pyrinomonadaceae bacterium]
MYCANCGADDQDSKTYCRQCGKWIGASPPEARMTVMIVFNALSALFGAASAIALYSNLGKGAEWPIQLAGTFCIVISVYQTISFLFALSLRMRLKQERDKRELDPPREVPALRAADTSQFVRAPSVTESTTELLERKKR